ncbi:TadE/TadG family type IV pilus assembly protein [Agrococcus sp. ARC_14]|uniref:TadE/TadG family type IV pilus assembly protein n=1 Tax=Agrococcus sp. ARC_14 TaxID=2919927 RepID=UPI001F069385|nr:TadE/TadG family type IV pilus assembly protein [Agrococcus sp. ARC_14]MCH1883728.1 pilus assembly protein TadG-related protein [Agrococcus sp. ARC_14]
MQRMKRATRDRGAVAVWVAILMVPLLIAAALAIDISAAHADRQRLQHGADAAALAVAQQCSVTPCTDATADAVAQELAESNEPLGGAPTANADLDAGWVEVQNSSDREYWFAPVLGVDDAAISAASAASWGFPTGGSAVMPFAFSWCELAVQAGLPPIRNDAGAIVGIQIPEAGVTRTVLASKKADSGCTGPSGNVVPGGFGWLEPTEGCGDTVTDIDSWAPSDPGNAPPNGCSPTDFSKWVGQTILLPVFDVATGNGNNAEYRIFGYIAFRLEAYYFAGQYVTPERPCDGSERCLRGTFLRYADTASDFDHSPTGPQMGASVVELRLPEER